MAPPDPWLVRDAGPVVRPYALTGGRTEPGGPALDLVDVIMAGRVPVGDEALGLSPEQVTIMRLCRDRATVADLASDLGLPLGVVRVLLADLIGQNLVSVAPQLAERPQATTSVLREVLDGLRAL
jgi:hypothetical protein